MAKILVVDDDKGVRDAMAVMLAKLARDTGIQYQITASPSEVITRIASGEQVDLIISDYKMGVVIDGVGLMKLIHQQKEIPVIIMSGDDVEEHVMKAGASGFLRKAFTNQQLVEKINHVLGLKLT